MTMSRLRATGAVVALITSVASTSLAQTASLGGPVGDYRAGGLSKAGGTVAGATTFSAGLTSSSEASLNEGFEATGDYDPICTAPSLRFDYDGVQACGPITDAAPDIPKFLAASAYPAATVNTTGANIIIRPGSGVHRAAMTAANFVNNTTTITITMEASATVGTEGTAFECNTVTDTVCANNVANWADALAGIHACSTGSTVPCSSYGITAVAGTAYFFPAPEDSPGKVIDSIACSTPTAATLTQGVNGQLAVGAFGTQAIPAYTFAGDMDTGLAWVAANDVGLTAGGTLAYDCTTSTCTWFGGVFTFNSTNGFIAQSGSYKAWLFQNQDTVFDARLIGSADATTEVAARSGTKYTDAQIVTAGSATDIRIHSFCTDCDGTPVEKAWVSNNGSINITGAAAGIGSTGTALGGLCTTAGGGGACVGPLSALSSRLSSDPTGIVSASLAATTLSVTTTVSTYRLEAHVMFNNSTAAEGASFDFNGGAATLVGGDMRVDCTINESGQVANDTVTETTTLAGLITKATLVGTGAAFMDCRGTVSIGVAGTFILRAAEGAAHATGTLTLRRGSYLILQPLP